MPRGQNGEPMVVPCGEVFHDLAHKSDQELEFVPVVCVEHNVIINEISIFIFLLLLLIFKNCP